MQPPVVRPHVPPRHHIPATTVTSHSSDVIPPIPKPRTRSASPKNVEVGPKPVIKTGVRVLPPITTASISNPLPQLPSYSSVPVAVTETPVLPSYEAAISTHPPAKPVVVAAAPAPTTNRYTLPDPSSSLSPTELEVVSQLTLMGFPPPRVARATKRLKDSAKVRIILVIILSEIFVLRFWIFW